MALTGERTGLRGPPSPSQQGCSSSFVAQIREQRAASSRAWVSRIVHSTRPPGESTGCEAGTAWDTPGRADPPLSVRVQARVRWAASVPPLVQPEASPSSGTSGTAFRGFGRVHETLCCRWVNLAVAGYRRRQAARCRGPQKSLMLPSYESASFISIKVELYVM
ncbi:hypothetical protein NDU88_004516 [Pleurodeles waltl]|uniref:Uncharacterized protein n=1 Tax=Pleurodeles waltl TaxID=8319 RepID=A0AAV7NTY6_PLEWA|nr:hypothetical protein NDU88_004516 [Pleurodeles waltl]